MLPLPRLVMGDVKVPRAARHALARRLRRAGQAAAISPDAWSTLGVRIVDDAEMARLHVEFMGEAGPTDVMAFPASASSGDEFEDDDFDDDEADDDEEDDDDEDDDDEADDDTLQRVGDGSRSARTLRSHGPLGDIVIDWAQVRRQARDGSLRALVDEATILLVHGLCHLLGHDHRRRGEGRRMHHAEARLLRALHVADVPRPYAPKTFSPRRGDSMGRTP